MGGLERYSGYRKYSIKPCFHSLFIIECNCLKNFVHDGFDRGFPGSCFIGPLEIRCQFMDIYTYALVRRSEACIVLSRSGTQSGSFELQTKLSRVRSSGTKRFQIHTTGSSIDKAPNDTVFLGRCSSAKICSKCDLCQ